MVKGKRSHSTRFIAVTISLSVYDETGMHIAHAHAHAPATHFTKCFLFEMSFAVLIISPIVINLNTNRIETLAFQSKRKVLAFQPLVHHPSNECGAKPFELNGIHGK